MDFSLALLRHRLAARRGAGTERSYELSRPDGPVLRVHLCPKHSHGGAERLLGDLQVVRPDVSFVVSGVDSGMPENAIPARCPPDTDGAARDHLDHWQPDAMMFSGPDPFPVLWTEALGRGTGMIAVDADPARYPFALVKALNKFDFLHAKARDPRLEPPILLTAPLASTPPPPMAIQSDLDDLSELLTTRPVWFAASVPKDEIEPVLEAHEEAGRLSHRLLLIVEPSDADAGDALHQRLDGSGWHSCSRTEGEDPQADTQILIADEPGEIGLWARLASICYIGGSLSVGAACDPIIPASLGSVIVHGPRPGAYGSLFRTLDGTNGAVPIGGSDRLGSTIESLLSPERCARIAHEAWDIATRGAETSNRALEALDQALPRTPES